MTLFYSRQDHATVGIMSRALLHLAASRAGAAFTCIHQAIVTAKTRRMQGERMFHLGFCDDGLVESHASHDLFGNAAKFPQLPLILGDKWDF